MSSFTTIEITDANAGLAVTTDLTTRTEKISPILFSGSTIVDSSLYQFFLTPNRQIQIKTDLRGIFTVYRNTNLQLAWAASYVTLRPTLIEANQYLRDIVAFKERFQSAENYEALIAALKDLNAKFSLKLEDHHLSFHGADIEKPHKNPLEGEIKDRTVTPVGHLIPEYILPYPQPSYEFRPEAGVSYMPTYSKFSPIKLLQHQNRVLTIEIYKYAFNPITEETKPIFQFTNNALSAMIFLGYERHEAGITETFGVLTLDTTITNMPLECNIAVKVNDDFVPLLFKYSQIRRIR